MKPEEMVKRCPECNESDKNISRRSSLKVNPDATYIAHIPQGDVTVIRCSNCGFVFQQCAHGKPPLEVKKILV